MSRTAYVRSTAPLPRVRPVRRPQWRREWGATPPVVSTIIGTTVARADERIHTVTRMCDPVWFEDSHSNFTLTFLLCEARGARAARWAVLGAFSQVRLLRRPWFTDTSISTHSARSLARLHLFPNWSEPHKTNRNQKPETRNHKTRNGSPGDKSIRHQDHLVTNTHKKSVRSLVTSQSKAAASPTEVLSGVALTTEGAPHGACLIAIID